MAAPLPRLETDSSARASARRGGNGEAMVVKSSSRCLLRCGFAAAVIWCLFVEIVEKFVESEFGMVLDGDWFLVLSGSSLSECISFARVYACPLSLAVVSFLAAAAIVALLSLRSSRRVFLALVFVAAAAACVRIAQAGSFRAWKPVYVAFDTLRSARDYGSVGSAGRWTDERAAKVRRAPECATNYVFVIGESMTTARLPFFGYGKDTTPHLAAMGGRLATLGPVRAPSPYTVTSLMALLVSGGATAPVWFRLAGYRTCFVGAQDRWERYCSVEAAIFSACERKVYLSDVAKGDRVYDGQLLPYAEDMMASGDGRPFALFIHMLGSHFPPEDRVPPGFAEGEGLDGYDRSVRYTDEVLARLMEALPPRTELFFVSDHGESVDSGGWRDLRSEALWSVPMIVYPAAAAQHLSPSADDFVSAWRARCE